MLYFWISISISYDILQIIPTGRRLGIWWKQSSTTVMIWSCQLVYSHFKSNTSLFLFFFNRADADIWKLFFNRPYVFHNIYKRFLREVNIYWKQKSNKTPLHPTVNPVKCKFKIESQIKLVTELRIWGLWYNLFYLTTNQLLWFKKK